MYLGYTGHVGYMGHVVYIEVYELSDACESNGTLSVYGSY